MRLQRVVELVGQRVLAREPLGRRRIGAHGVAGSLRRRRDARPLLRRLVGCGAGELEVGFGLFLLVAHRDQRSGIARRLEAFRDDQRQRLAAVEDRLVVERAERLAGRRHLIPVAAAEPGGARSVLVRIDFHHARNRNRSGDVDAGDPAAGDRARHGIAVEKVRNGELRGIGRTARHLVRSIDAAARAAEMPFVSQHGWPLKGCACRSWTAACRPRLGGWRAGWRGARGRS